MSTPVLEALGRSGLDFRGPSANGAIRFRCPSCSKLRAFVYTDSETGSWTCNRRGNCGASGRLLGARPPIRPRRDKPAHRQGKHARDLSAGLGPRARSLPFEAQAWLRRRFGELAHQVAVNCAEELFNTAAASLPHSQLRAGQGFALGVVKRDLADPQRISSAAYRWTGRGHPPAGTKKSMSAGGSPGGRWGPAFGDGPMAAAAAAEPFAPERRLRQAYGQPVLVVCEGEVDWLTCRGALELLAVLGAPHGVGSAAKMIRWLRSTGWRGQVLLALDGDPAGRNETARIAKALEGQDAIGLIVADPGRNAEGRGLDLNDLLAAGGVEAVWACLLSAVAVDLGQAEKTSDDDRRREDLTPTGARQAFRRFARENPPDADAPGLSRYGRIGRCRQSWHRRPVYDARTLALKKDRFERWACGRVDCPDCRADLLTENRARMEAWRQREVYRLALDFEDEVDVEAHQKARSKLMRTTGKARKAEAHGFITVLNPGRLEVYLTGSEELRQAAARALGAEPRRLEGEELLEAFERSLFARAERSCGLALDAPERLGADPWARKRLRQLALKGSLLPFEASSSKGSQAEGAEEEDEREDEIALNSFGDSSGALCISLRQIGEANEDRAYYGRLERLWQDANFVRILANAPEWFDRFPRTRQLVEVELERCGGASPRLAGTLVGSSNYADRARLRDDFEAVAQAVEDRLRPPKAAASAA